MPSEHTLRLSPGAAILHPDCLTRSAYAIDHVSEKSFPEDLAELFNLLEAIALKTTLVGMTDLPGCEPPSVDITD